MNDPNHPSEPSPPPRGTDPATTAALETRIQQLELALARAERRFHFLGDTVSDGIFVFKNSACLDANRSAATMFGYQDPADLLGVDQRDLLAAQENTELPTPTDGHEQQVIHTIAQRLDGSTFPAEIIIRTTQYQDDPPITVIAVRDLQEQRNLEQRFQLATQITNDLLYEWDAASDRYTWYGAIERTLGLTPADRPTTTIELKRRLHPDDLAAFEQAVTSRSIANNPVQFDYRIVRKDGSWRYFTDRSAPVVIKHGRAVTWLGVCTDITTLKQTEQEKVAVEKQLLQSQKMEAIGRLAGGIAHDVNNVLGVILNSATMITLEQQEHPTINEDLENIVEACKRGRDLTRNLLGFARKGKYIKRNVSLNKIINSAVSLLSRTISKKIKITLELEPDLPRVEGDPGQLEHALMNLFINAADAMEDEGALTVRAMAVELSQKHMGQLKLQPGPHVRVLVEDSGKGMDEATIAKAFDPFFTTKPEGKGTGLGLSMVYGTVRSHKGDIQIDSQMGKGTRISFTLPAVGRRLSSIPSATVWPTVTTATGREQILLVDDEPMILTSSKRVLERMGYRVETAPSGEAALALLCQPHQFDLAILDMIMPDMDGAQLFEQIRSRNSNLRVIICSGYARDKKIDNLLARGVRGFLQKPYNLEQLAEAISTVLSKEE